MPVTVAGWGWRRMPHVGGIQERRLVTQDSWLLAEFQLLWVCGRVSLALPFGWVASSSSWVSLLRNPGF